MSLFLWKRPHARPRQKKTNGLLLPGQGIRRSKHGKRIFQSGSIWQRVHTWDAGGGHAHVDRADAEYHDGPQASVSIRTFRCAERFVPFGDPSVSLCELAID